MESLHSNRPMIKTAVYILGNICCTRLPYYFFSAPSFLLSPFVLLPTTSSIYTIPILSSCFRPLSFISILFPFSRETYLFPLVLYSNIQDILIRKMQIKTTLRIHFLTVTMAKTNKTSDNACCVECRM